MINKKLVILKWNFLGGIFLRLVGGVKVVY